MVTTNQETGSFLDLHAQPFASSIVSAKSAVEEGPFDRSLLRSFRISLASTLTLATSFTMQPILRVLFSRRYRSRVVFPETMTQLIVSYLS